MGLGALLRSYSKFAESMFVGVEDECVFFIVETDSNRSDAAVFGSL